MPTAAPRWPAGEPIGVNVSAWLHEEADGLIVVAEERESNGHHILTIQTLVPWATLCEAVDRYRNAKRRA